MTSIAFRPPPAEGIIPLTSAVVSGRNEAIVWDPLFFADTLLVKWKYTTTAGRRVKLPHSMNEYDDYEQVARRLGAIEELPTDGFGSLLPRTHVEGYVPPRLLDDDEIPAVVALLTAGGIARERISAFGSRATRTARPDSDWDLVITAMPDEIRTLRRRLAAAWDAGRIVPTPGSGTLGIFDRWARGGAARLMREHRYTETFALEGIRISIAYQPPGRPPTFRAGCEPLGFTTLRGRVLDATASIYRPSLARVEGADNRLVLLVNYAKFGMTLREGDEVDAAGWLVRDGDDLKLLQLSPQRETLAMLS